MFRFGVDSLIWTEDFSQKDVPLIAKAKDLGFEVIDINIRRPETFPLAEVKDALKNVEMQAVTTIGLPAECNLIDTDQSVRRHGVTILKKLVDINMEIGSQILGGVIYAAWGYLSGACRTDQEWQWSLECMREVAEYAKSQGDLTLAVEPVNRFESHFLNIADDAVRYCHEVGTGNVKVHLDSFHMIREEADFSEAVRVCGKDYLGYIHACENNRGIPGTGLVPWKEFFSALVDVGYDGPLVIESFDPGFEELNRLCAIWRKFADTGEELAVKGLDNLKRIAAEVPQIQ
ncbi:sugar phosphate isomerase/epimerase family protein [Thermodesulfobacteriota bacterium]